MKVRNDIDFTTLSWVKHELDETLKQARQALEAYVEDTDDTSQMRFCATYLHQVQGTLRMVELYGAALVVEEMEQVALALLEQEVQSTDEAYAVLMRGIVQLPDYLERLQSGHRDIPVVLLPLLNDLRVARGEKLVSENVLFSPDLNVELPAVAAGPRAPLNDAKFRLAAVKLRKVFEVTLLNWFKGDSDKYVHAMEQILEKLRKATCADTVRRLWWIAHGVLRGISTGEIETSMTLKLLFGRVDQQIKRLALEGETAMALEPPNDLCSSLLYYIAHAEGKAPEIKALKDLYKLDELLPRDEELEHARGSMAGHNKALLGTVSGAIKEDLMRVKESLDLQVRKGDMSSADYEPLLETLGRVGDTLGMLGLGMPRTVVQDQLKRLEQLSQGQEVSDDELLDIAGSLLFVEASLDDNIDQLGSAAGPTDQQAVTGELPRSEVRRILDALMKESSNNLQAIKKGFIDFIESPWDHDRIGTAPQLLEEIIGALKMLDLNEAGELLTGVSYYIETELLRQKVVPSADQLDTLADAVASVEYYLEAVRENRSNRDKILEVAKSSLTKLGYYGPDGLIVPEPEPEPEVEEAAAEEAPQVDTSDRTPTAEMAAEQAQEVFDTGELELALEEAGQPEPDLETQADAAEDLSDDSGFEQVEVEASQIEEQQPAAAQSFKADISDDIDDEIKEVFIEEAEEELENLRELYPSWRNDQEDVETLTTVRRIFHTLKGSGRLVGALTIGEFSWQVENLLNRVLDGSVDASPAVIALMDQVVDALPQLVANVKGEGPPTADIEGIKSVAERLADGEEAYLSTAAPEPAEEAIAEEEPEQVEAAEEQPETEAEVTPEEPLEAEQAASLESTDEAAEISLELDALLDKAAADEAIEQPVEADQELTEEIEAVADLTLETEDVQEEAEPESSEDMEALFDEDDFSADDLDALDRAEEITGQFSVEDILAAGERREQQADQPEESEQPADAETTAETELEQEATELEAVELEELEEELDLSSLLSDDEESSEPEVAESSEEEAETAEFEIPEPSEEISTEAVELEGFGDLEEVSAELEESVDELAFEMDTAASSEVVTGQQPAPIDPVLFEILQSEVKGHLKVIDEFVADSGESSTAPVASEELLRAVHTLHGAVAMVDVSQLADITGPLEGYIKRLHLKQAAPSEAGLRAMSQCSEVVTEVVTQLGNEHPQFPPIDQLHQTLVELRDEHPEPENITSLFPVETGEYSASELDTLEVVDLEAEDSASEQPETLHEAGELPTFDDETVEDIEAVELEAEPSAEAVEEGEPADESEQFVESLELESDESVDLGDLDADDFDISEAEEALEQAAAEIEAEADEIDAEPTEEVISEVSDLIAEAAQDIAEEASQQQVDEEVSEDEQHETEQQPEEEEAVSEETAGAVPEAIAATAAGLAGLAAAADVVDFSDLGEIDEELLEIFIEEGTEILDASDRQMVEWRDDPESRDAMASLQRELHTLKGGARMAGLAPIGDLSHAMESLFEAVTDSTIKPTKSMVETMEGAFDRLHQMLGQASQRGSIITGADFIDRIASHLAGEEPVSTPVADPSAAPAQPSDAPAAPAPSVSIQKATALDVEAQKAGTTQARPQQELIRVRANLLDNLVNYAGEVSIYRSRMEQQIGTFRFNLTEFGQTVSRLREQLRKLEIETEAQILSRYQREAEEMDEQFDPLELDRFSQMQQYSRALAESVSDLVSIQDLLDDLTRQSETLLLQQSRVTSDLQEGLMRTRMVPFDSLVPRLRRILRQTAQELGRKAQLRVEGAQGEMDRTVLERITAPLEHMLRNAVAHGIETPDERVASGKPEEGLIRITVSREATEVVIRIDDDGAGIDAERVRQKAIARGLLSADTELGEHDLYGFIIESGFSTAEEVTKVAGRGVGMDVVNSEIKQLGGSLNIDSNRGEGSSFTVRLPFTLAVTHAIMVRAGDANFAIPLSSIQGVVRMRRDEFDRRMKEDETEYEYNDEVYQLQELAILLGGERSKHIDDDMIPILMSRLGDQRAAVRVDSVISSREIVVKPVGPQISSIPGIFGATILGDGSVIMILDLGPLVRRGVVKPLTGDDELDALEAAPVEERPPVIMVVDDSITMRKVTSRVLQRNEMDVMTAKDGVDAVEQLQEKQPDLMLLDVEMPRMDGYELAQHMKSDSRLRHIPIIMITSRTGEKHRQRAFEIGVSRYLGKPYQEADLMQQVRELLGEPVDAD